MDNIQQRNLLVSSVLTFEKMIITECFSAILVKFGHIKFLKLWSHKKRHALLWSESCAKKYVFSESRKLLVLVNFTMKLSCSWNVYFTCLLPRLLFIPVTCVVPLQDLSAWSINGGHETDERATCPLPWKNPTRCYPNAVPTSNDVSTPLDQHLSSLLPHHACLYHRSRSSWKSFGHVAAIRNNWQILCKAGGLSVFGQIICLQVARFCWLTFSLKTDVPVFIGHRNKMAPRGKYISNTSTHIRSGTHLFFWWCIYKTNC